METVTTVKRYELVKEYKKTPKDTKFVVTLLIPGIIIFAIAIVFPIVSGIYISFTNSSAVTGFFGNKVTIVNYYELLSYGNVNTRQFWQYTYQTLFFSIVSLVLEFFLGLVFALILNKKFKGRGLARATILIPWAIPTVASATIFRFEIFNTAEDNGAINGIIDLFGGREIAFFGPDAAVISLDSILLILMGIVIFYLGYIVILAIIRKQLKDSIKRIIIVSAIIGVLALLLLIRFGVFSNFYIQSGVDPPTALTQFSELEIKMTMFTVIIIDVWKTTPFITLLILASLQIVPQDLYKAGDIAGASSWQKFRYITWPLIKPGVGVALIFRMMQALRVYDAIVVFNDSSVRSMTSHAVLLWLNSDYGKASTISVLLLVLIALFALVITLVTRREKRSSSKKSPKSHETKKPIEKLKGNDEIVLKDEKDIKKKTTIFGSTIGRKIEPISETTVKWYIWKRRLKKVIFIALAVFMCVFCALPFIWIVLRSFRDPFITQTHFELFPEHLSLGAYLVIFQHADVYGVTFDKALLNGFILSGTTVIIVIIVGSFIAYAIAKFKFRGKGVLNSFIFSMNSLPPLIIIIPFYIQIVSIARITADISVDGFLLIIVGILIFVLGYIVLSAIIRRNLKASIKKIVIVSAIIGVLVLVLLIGFNFFSNTYGIDLRNNLFGLSIPYAAFNLPLAVFILIAFFREIPQDLWNAAKVDGATNFQIFLRVIFPLAIPGIFTCAILVFIASWNELLFAQIFLTDPQNHTVPVAILRYLRNPQSLTADWNTDIALLAATTIATVPLVIVVLIFQKKIVSGLTSGAVKG